MHAPPPDLLRYAREGYLYYLIEAWRPEHAPYWGQLLDAAARAGRVSVVVWLVRLRALEGQPVDPVTVLPADADERVREVCRSIREVDEALEYQQLLQQERAEKAAKEAKEAQEGQEPQPWGYHRRLSQAEVDLRHQIDEQVDGAALEAALQGRPLSARERRNLKRRLLRQHGLDLLCP